MKPHRKVYIVGGAITPFIGKHHPDFIWRGHADFGTKKNATLEELTTRAVRDALASTGVEASAIERGYVGNFAGELFSNQGHMGSMAVRADPELSGTPFIRVEGACASGGLAVVGAVESIQAGLDVVMALGSEVQTTVSAREGAGFLARAAHWESERALDEFTFPAMFARRAKHYEEAYGVGESEIAPVVVKAYANANRNPLAHMRAVEVDAARAQTASDKNPRFLRNEELKPYLKVTDCSQVSDGAAALILASEQGLKALGKDPADCVEITGYGVATSPLGDVDDYTFLGTTNLAANEAYDAAGIGPGDVQVAEVHDCFAITELMMYEALGFAARGKGAALAAAGETEIDGSIPVNTGGGLMAFGHPVGATGIKQALEVFRQMKGQCGDYQIAERPKVGVTANMGGDDRTSVVIAYRDGA